MKIMDVPNSKGRSGFWEAYRACAEENRVASIHLSGAPSLGVPGMQHYQKKDRGVKIFKEMFRVGVTIS